ncbi:uncharacterized protein LOC122022897 [Zingiber officinale]|uniref:Legume lectin domain-containing protein n=1 Tax=Zingiber officinale TaxID=94328 RepID=A0A8J5KGW5_ZINOF|nr:uncharacterized protein LOC122022897 [Zingiber officinale]KAG6475892.1 hypothetical protein ZIOFF_065122 [Zingiber officinale]
MQKGKSFEGNLLPHLRILMMLPSPAASTFALAAFLLLAASFSCGNREEDGKGSVGFRFSFDGSVKDRSFGAEFDLHGDARVSGSSVRITRPANVSSGRMAYREPIRFFGTKSGFSSAFSFSIPPAGCGVAFFLSPSRVSPEGGSVDRAESSISLIAVSFATAKTGNLTGSLIEISASGELLAKSGNLSSNGSVLHLKSGEKLHSEIDFDGESNRIQVKLWQGNSMISHAVDLPNFPCRESVLVSLTARSRNSTQGISIYSWNFTAKHGAPYLMHSEPLDPNSFLARPTEIPSVHPRRRAYPWAVFIAMVFAAASGAMVAFFVMLVWAQLDSQCPVAPEESPATIEKSGENMKTGKK